MKIEELDDVESDGRGYSEDRAVYGSQIVRVDAKRAIVGAGARILFYPTLLYNVFRNKIQAEFRWWDEIDQVLVLIFFIDMHICNLCVKYMCGVFVFFVLYTCVLAGIVVSGVVFVSSV